jgi:hypothetical protein
MITVDQILGFARDAINTDAAIASWMTTNYSATLKVYVGVDLSDPPSEADAPFVVLTASLSDYEVGEMSDTREPVFEVDFALLDTTKTTSGNVTTYAGQANICALGDLIRAALKEKFQIDRFQSCALSFVGVAPLWQGGMTVRLLYEQGVTETVLTVNAHTGWVGMAQASLPEKPTGLAGTPFSASQIDLTWNAVTATTVQIYRAPDVAGVAGTYALIASQASSDTTYSATGLVTATKYWFRIQAHNEVGNSPFSDAVSATTS